MQSENSVPQMPAAAGSSPLVSVIIPTYNRGNFIAESIESVLSQTYTNWELIIVDDGSTDHTEDVVRPYLSEKVRYCRLPHTGRSAARNSALRLAKGELIAYLDSDDVFLPRKLEKQVRWLVEHPETAMVYASALLINDYGEYHPMLYVASDSGNIYERVGMYLPVVIMLPSVVIRREVQEKVGGFDEDLDRFEDTDMWRRISRDYRIDAIAEPLLKVRTHLDNRIESLDPAKLFADVKKYAQKAAREDGKAHPKFISMAAARLLFHYGDAVSKVPGWEQWEQEYLREAAAYRPVYTFAKIWKRRLKKLLRR